MAITKEHKQELVARYSEWLKKSQALFVTQYTGLSMKEMDAVRGKLREMGGEFHIIKNTLAGLAFEQAGMPIPKGLFEGSTAVCFAFKDAPALAKTMMELSKTYEFLKLKGGYLAKAPMTADNVKSLADLPPLPIVRAQLLGTLLAPASRLARTLAEPARGLAAVLKAHAEPAAAAA